MKNKQQQPALSEDYQRQIDAAANSPEAQELLKSVYEMAGFYFDYLRARGVYVSHISIANEAAANSAGPSIDKYISAGSLHKGGDLVGKH